MARRQTVGLAMNEQEIKEMISKYLDAEMDILAGKNVMWGNRLLQRENLAEIRKGRQEWEARLVSVRNQGRPSHSLASFPRY